VKTVEGERRERKTQETKRGREKTFKRGKERSSRL